MVCSFTGHRSIKSEHRGEISSCVARAVKYAYSKGCRRFMTGGAIGFDTVAAKEVIKFRKSHPDVSLTLMLPCLNQSEHWNERQKREYDFIFSQADEAFFVSREYTDTCMRERNSRLAKEADILIAYVGRTNSGSAQTVRMATAYGKEVYNIYPYLDKNSDG